ncbi:MAG: hypothetical protein Q4A82_02470 [Corynebacterium sp.]|nr:hypothetical protein [Corynebacterium sp.]
MSNDTTAQYFSLSWICVRRGWDRIAVEKFLATPDVEMPHSNGAITALYFKDRVKEIENSFEYRVDTWRRQGLRRDGETLNRILQQFYIDPRFTGLSKGSLQRSALWHYVSREHPDYSEEMQKYLVTLLYNDSDSKKEHLMVNYLRHMGTNYEQLVSATEGRREFYMFILWHALNCISEEYPYLKAACERQLEFKRNETGDFAPPRSHAPYIPRAHKQKLLRKADRKWRKKHQRL